MKKNHLARGIAVLMIMVLLSSISIPAFATTETKAVDSKAAVTAVKAGKKKTILIGDSRTANLRQVRNNGNLIYDLLQQDGSIFWDFKWGAKFIDLTTNLIPRLELSGLDTIDNKTTIVLWMGYNDAVGLPTATVEEYVAYYNLMAMTWIARGANVYVMNVGPSGRKKGATQADKEEYKQNNKKIRAFNKTLKNGLLPQIHYIDCYGYLMDTDYATSDGTHYVAVTSRGIYKFVMNAIR